jgi:hypothetical protein
VEGDIFLFFGLFRQVIHKSGRLEWDTGSVSHHVLWGWLQIGEILNVDNCDVTRYKWAVYHPHFHRSLEKNNTVYISRSKLKLSGMQMEEHTGSGVFTCFSKRLQLTAPSAKTPSLWQLPQWLYPSKGISPLKYHGDLTRWQKTKGSTLLNTVTRGQEFILDCEEYPEAVEWFKMLLEAL